MAEPVAVRAVSKALAERAALEAIDELRREPVTVALLAACGATPCHLVGGAVRDRALGLVTHDLDAVVAGRGREIASSLAASLPARLVLLGGKEFAAFRLVTPAGAVLDLWDREAMSLADDLARRDFTVNAIAVEARTGVIVDPFGGLADLVRRTLRAVTAESFRGDPLRVLRLVRFELQLPGFGVEPATLELAHAAAPRLREMAAERIREELRLIFSHPGAERGLLRLATLGVYPAQWLEESDAASSAGLGGLAPEAVEGKAACSAVTQAAAELAALPVCAARLELWLSAAGSGIEIEGEGGVNQAGAWDAPDLLAARLAASCRHLGSLPAVAMRPVSAPAAERQGHGDAAAPAAARTAGVGSASPYGRAALDRLDHAGYITPRQAAEIRPLLDPSLALPPAGGSVEKLIERRRYLHRHGRRWLTAACAAGGVATVRGRADRERWRRGARALCELARREGGALIAPPRLLSGDEVQRLLGIPAGPAVGRALAALTAAQVDGAVRTRDEAERYLMRSRAAAPAPAPPAGGRDDSTAASDDEIKSEGAGAKTGGRRGASRPRPLSGRRRPARPSGAG